MNIVTVPSSVADLVLQIAERTRVSLESLWPEHDDFLGGYGAPASTGQCGRSSCVLVRLLSEELPDGDWRLAGGLEDVRDRMNTDDLVPDAQSGGMVWSGFWQDHYWVVSEAYGLIVDVTADQFGHAPVVVCGLDDPRYRENLLPGVADRHSMDWRLDVERWLGEIRSSASPSPR